jgi:hypothetical protein
MPVVGLRGASRVRPPGGIRKRFEIRSGSVEPDRTRPDSPRLAHVDAVPLSPGLVGEPGGGPLVAEKIG